jgi:outer membrane protein assembly factor BamB
LSFLVGCDKSHAMKIARVVLTVLPLLGVYACSGGGGGSSAPPGPAWPKFRHDASNSGQGNGVIESSTPQIKWQTQIDPTTTPNPISASPAPTPKPKPISASAAIDANGTIYVATEGGTLASLNPATGDMYWSVTSCQLVTGAPIFCPDAVTHPQSLGPLISSPAFYNYNSLNYVFLGSANGFVYMFQDNGTTRTCAACFQPTAAHVGSVPLASRFISSPTFTISPLTGAVSSVIIGAAIDVSEGGTTRTIGQMYALNTDGSLIWQFPKAGEQAIGAITSSPALGAANAVSFTTDDGYLYSLAEDGVFKWRFHIGTVKDPAILFRPSPLTSNLIFAPTTDGQIFAIDPDGSFRWSASSPKREGFLSSLAVGVPAVTTPTVTPSVPPTPTPPPGATNTPTATITPLLPTTAIFGVTVAGTLVQIDATTGEMNLLLGPAPPIAGPVISSPFLSFDGYLVVGAADGKLHAINTITGQELAGWPVTLAAGIPIRSSPSVDDNGVVYVGADNGIFYAVGTQ